MENLSVYLSDVFSACEVFEVVDEVEKFFVVLVVVPGNDRDPVVELIAERIGSVINDDNVLNPSVAQDPQVLDEHPVDHQAVFPVQPVMDELATGVEVVQHDVRVAPMRSGEDYDLEALVGLPQALPRVRPDVDPRVHELPCRELDLQHHVRLSRDVVHAVDQSLVQVKHNRLPALKAWPLGQVHPFLTQLRCVHTGQVPDKFESLEGLEKMLSVIVLTSRLDLLLT